MRKGFTFYRVNLLCFMLAFGLGACSTAEKATLQSDDPQMAMQEVTSMMRDLKAKQVDFLAPREYKDGKGDWAEAKEDISEGDEAGEILDSLAMAKAHFLKAQAKADQNRGKVNEDILSARENAKRLGVPNEKLSDRLADIDDDYRASTDYFTDDIDATEVGEFQKRYSDLEGEMVQARELSAMREIIQNAKNKDADDLAPNTLEKARTDLELAENKISQFPRYPEQYDEALMQSNRSAKLLQDVMDKLTGDAEGAPEQVALDLVYKEREIGNLTDTLATTKLALVGSEAELYSAERNLAFDDSMEKVRKEIPSDDAEVFRQGSDLIIRVKDIDFQTGSAAVPEDAKPVLSKIQTAVSSIQPSAVEVQGHTDSSGSENLNKKLSQKRAEAVAAMMASNNPDYVIESKGYGESQPLVSNNTASGRQTNRRVDIVVKTQ